MSWLRIAPAALAAFFLAAPLIAQPRVEGAWHPEVYTLKDGTVQEVTGLIFFTDREWGRAAPTLSRGIGLRSPTSTICPRARRL
jgi:hypothetical protein